MRCKVSKLKIKPFMSFGKMPMANGFLRKKFQKEFYYKLEVGFNKKNFISSDDHPNHQNIQQLLPTNKSKYMVNHFKNIFYGLKNKKS